MLTLTDIGLAALLAVTAYVYSQVLTAPEMVLNGWYCFLERHIGHIRWLFKPLVECCYCVAGQLGLWVYGITNAYDINVLSWVNFVCITIFFTEIAQKTWNWKANS
jgi:hypothetical protein